MKQIKLIKGPITVNPDDPEVMKIVSTPCFDASPIAHILQRAGYPIKTHAEEEQGFVILWMLSLYQEHGIKWRDEGQKILNSLKGAVAPAPQESNAKVSGRPS